MDINKTVSRWLCFMLLSAALCVTALAGEVGPYTIQGTNADGKFTISFSAVSVSKATVMVLDPYAAGGASSLNKTMLPVTVLEPAPGCKAAIPQATEFFENAPCVNALSATGHLWSGFMFDGNSARARYVKIAPGRVDALEPNRGIFINAKPPEADTLWGTEVYLLLTTPSTPSGDSGYAPLTIEGHSVIGGNDGLRYVLSFESVKTGTKTITRRACWDDGAASDGLGYGEYKSEQVTLVKVRPGSTSYLFGTNMEQDSRDLYAEVGSADGNNRYTFWNGGSPLTLVLDVLSRPYGGYDFINAYQSPGKCWIPSASDGNQRYLIQLDTDSGFEDVSESSYYACPVLWAVSGGVTKGVTKTTFAPHNTCTRTQILTFIWRYAGEPEPEISNPYQDVSPDRYYYKAALWAYEKGMVNGREFQGDTLCTRAAAVRYLWILAGSPAVGGGQTFTDVPPGADYAPAVTYAAEHGITEGTSADTFSPNKTCTRAQIMTFLYRYHASKEA